MPPPSVVLDTNVVVSGHLKDEGHERFVLDLALARKLRLLLSSEILEEYRGVLSREKFGIARKRLESSLELIGKAGEMVQPSHRVTAAKDPDDNKFLECAEEGKADYLVTGNKRHFPAQWRGTRVVNARELLEETIPQLKR